MNNSVESRQMEVCRKYGTDCCPPTPESKLGLARDVAADIQPLNGLRHPIQGDTCGWYIWRGRNLSLDADYFQPMHVEHIMEKCPESVEFLALPPGWRFLIAPGQTDVWFDESLLSAV
jgi:hypothetical protein